LIKRIKIFLELVIVLALLVYLVSVWFDASNGQFYMYPQYGSAKLVDIVNGKLAFFSKLLLKSALFIIVIYYWSRDVLKRL
jgi:hypothetical protein